MKQTQAFLQTLVGVALVGALVVGLVVVFQGMSGANQSSRVVTAVSTGEPYPPPRVTATISESTGQPYPPPQTIVPSKITPSPAVSPTDPDVEATAMVATLIAEMTASAPTPISGNSIIYHPSGVFSLKLLPGWFALVGESMSIVNYDYAEAEQLGTVPPGGLGIQIGVDRLLEGQTFEQWQARWVALETSPDVAWSGTVASSPSPYQLGQYTGSMFTLTGPFPTIIEIDLLSHGQIVIIGLAPADSPALQEALEMLATLEIFSTPKP